MARSRYRWRHRRCRRAAPKCRRVQVRREVDDVGHVAFPFVGSGAQQRLPELAENPGRIVDIEQDRSDAVGAHRTDAVGEYQPPGIGLDGRAAVPELQRLPGLGRPLARSALVHTLSWSE